MCGHRPGLPPLGQVFRPWPIPKLMYEQAIVIQERQPERVTPYLASSIFSVATKPALFNRTRYTPAGMLRF